MTELLERDYCPPKLYIREEVEVGGGYHTLQVSRGPEREWSEPYSKSGSAVYRDRVVLVPYPPSMSDACPKTTDKFEKVTVNTMFGAVKAKEPVQ